NTLADELQERGVQATATTGPLWPVLSAMIVDDAINQKNTGPLVIVGHSYGGGDAVSCARVLKNFGVTVQLLLLLDATGPSPIPSNVDRCVQFYEPTLLGALTPPTMPGNPVVPEEGNDHTQI